MLRLTFWIASRQLTAMLSLTNENVRSRGYVQLFNQLAVAPYDGLAEWEHAVFCRSANTGRDGTLEPEDLVYHAIEIW